MLNMINRITTIMTMYQKLLLPIGILVSLALCFLGYKYLKAWVAGFGFVVGLAGGYLVSSQLIAESVYAPLLIGLLCGVVLMLAAFLLFKAGIFVLTAVLIGEIVYNLPIMDRVRAFYLPGTIGTKIVAAFPLVIAIAVGVIAGIAAIKLTRIVIIVVTGATGAYRAAMYLILLLGLQIDQSTRYIWVGIIVLLAVLGIVVQLFTTEKE